jgi:hypothetical protein
VIQGAARADLARAVLATFFCTAVFTTLLVWIIAH